MAVPLTECTNESVDWL